MNSEHYALLTGYMNDVWKNGDLSRMDRYFHEDIVCHDPYVPDICGLDEANNWVGGMRSTFTDSEVRIEDSVVEGNYIATRLRHSGTHAGEFLGRQPSGSKIINSAMALWRIEEGRICEIWQHWDALGVSRQIDTGKGVEGLLDGLTIDPGPTPATNYALGDTQMAANKNNVRRWMDRAWNHGEFDLVNECFTKDVWFWDPFGPVIKSRGEFKDWADAIDTAFPERSLSIDHVIAEGDKTAYRVTLRAKHNGDFLGFAATGKGIVASAMVMAIHENGCYKKAYQIFDVQKVLQDIGQA